MSFMHLFHKPLYTPMRCKRRRLVLRTPFAKCEPPRSNLRSLADEQARRLISLDYRLLMPLRFRLHSKSFILLASCTSSEVVLCTMFCYSQNARGAICAHSLTSQLVDSVRLIIYLRRTISRPLSIARTRHSSLRQKYHRFALFLVSWFANNRLFLQLCLCP